MSDRKPAPPRFGGDSRLDAARPRRAHKGRRLDPQALEEALAELEMAMAEVYDGLQP